MLLLDIIGGRTPWSARVPLDPLLNRRIRPTGASASDQGVRPPMRSGSRRTRADREVRRT
jgi:hypothetical protein